MDDIDALLAQLANEQDDARASKLMNALRAHPRRDVIARLEAGLPGDPHLRRLMRYRWLSLLGPIAPVGRRAETVDELLDENPDVGFAAALVAKVGNPAIAERLERRLQMAVQSAKRRVRAISLSRDGRYVVVAGPDSVSLHDVAGRLLSEVVVETDLHPSLSLLDDGRAILGSRGTYLIDFVHGTSELLLAAGEYQGFAPNGDRVAVKDDVVTIKREGTAHTTFAVQSGARSASFLPTGARIAVRSARTVAIHDRSTGERVAELEPAPSRIIFASDDIAVALVGAWMASDVVRIDLRSGKRELIAQRVRPNFSAATLELPRLACDAEAQIVAIYEAGADLWIWRDGARTKLVGVLEPIATVIHDGRLYGAVPDDSPVPFVAVPVAPE